MEEFLKDHGFATAEDEYETLIIQYNTSTGDCSIYVDGADENELMAALEGDI